MKNFVATSLQDKIFEAMHKCGGTVSLAILPTMRQCEMIQAIDPDHDWHRLTQYEAQNYLSNFYYYHNKGEQTMNDGAIVKNEEEVKCPHCGHQNYEVTACRTVCIDVTPIIRDGVMINRKPDGEEADCKCLYCGKRFTYRKKIFEVKRRPLKRRSLLKLPSKSRRLRP